MLINFTFNSYDFQNAFLVDETSTHQSMPEKSISDIQYLSRDGGARTGSRFPSKTITVTGTITGTSQSNYHQNKDTFKQYLGVKGAYELSIEDDEGVRVWPEVECRILDIKEGQGWVTAGEFTLEFYCYDPIARASSTTTVSDDDITATPHTSSVSFTGTYDPLPVITIDIDTVGTIDSLAFTHIDTGEQIIIEGISANGDQIIIDCDEQKITLNDVEVEGDGKIPSFSQGTNNYRVEVFDDGALEESQTGWTYYQNIYSTIYKAQSFQLSGAATIDKIDLLLNAPLGTPEADLTVALYDDDGSNNPDLANPVANGSTTIDKDNVSTGAATWLPAIFSTPPSVLGATTYWIVLSSSSTTYGKRYRWRFSESDLYANGSLSSSLDSGSNWTNYTSYDGTFKIYTSVASGFNVDFEFKYYPRYL